MYEQSHQLHSSGFILNEEEYRPEFDILKHSNYVDANDPLSDPRTRGYVENYIKPLKILSMLDTVIRSTGKNLGVMCFEHVNKPHFWKTEEIDFAGKLADQFTIALANRDRNQAQTALRENQAVLEKTNRQLEILVVQSKEMAAQAEAANKAKSEFLGQYEP